MKKRRDIFIKKLSYLLVLISSLFLFGFDLLCGNITSESSSLCLQKGCDDEKTLSCRVLGNISYASRDFTNAEKFLKKACDLGDTKGCNDLKVARLAQKLNKAELTCGSKDEVIICKKNVLKDACSEGLSVACLTNEENQNACLKNRQEKGGCLYTDFIPKNKSTTSNIKFYDEWCIEDKDFNLAQKCEGRDGGACYRLGIRQHKDLDYKEAQISLKKACRLIRNDACNFLKKNYPRHI
jgi:hypothetical protein